MSIGSKRGRTGWDPGCGSRLKSVNGLSARGQRRGLGTGGLISSALGLLAELIMARRTNQQTDTARIGRYRAECGDGLIPRSVGKSTEPSGPRARGTLLALVTVEQCVGCRLCTQICPALAMTIVNGVATVDAGRCTGCGECVSECPRDALTLGKA